MTPNFASLILVILAVVVASPTLRAQGLSAAERELLVLKLAETRKAVEAEARDLSPQQMTFKPKDGGWSIAECLEHLALHDKQMLFTLREKMLKDLPNAKQAPAVDLKSEQIFDQLLELGRSLPMTDALKPTGQFGDGRAALRAFSDQRKEMQDFAKKTQDWLHDYTHPSPLGVLDGYQWLVYASAYSRRIGERMRRIKTEPNYPKVAQMRESWNPYGG